MKTPRQSVVVTEVLRWQDGKRERVVDYLATEEPLEIRVNGVPLSVTMRTPGHDLELAAGFLFTEGVVESRAQLGAMRAPADRATAKTNLVEVDTVGVEYDADRMRRNFFAASSCGVCGKASIEAIRRRGLLAPNSVLRVVPEVLSSLGERLRSDQAIFAKTGGLHAAAIFNVRGDLLELREDIGRHNAVDKIVGWALLNDRLPLSEHILMVSGRGGFELVQKAIAAGIPMMASVSAPSSLAVQLARELGLTLIGFLRGSRFTVYSGGERLFSAPDVDHAS